MGALETKLCNCEGNILNDIAVPVTRKYDERWSEGVVGKDTMTGAAHVAVVIPPECARSSEALSGNRQGRGNQASHESMRRGSVNNERGGSSGPISVLSPASTRLAPKSARKSTRVQTGTLHETFSEVEIVVTMDSDSDVTNDAITGVTNDVVSVTNGGITNDTIVGPRPTPNDMISPSGSARKIKLGNIWNYLSINRFFETDLDSDTRRNLNRSNNELMPPHHYRAISDTSVSPRDEGARRIFF